MELTLEQALQKGVEAHKAGKAQEADRYYTAILQAQPKHPDANHNMGLLAVGVGKVEASLPFFKTALEANPKIEQFWLSYIDALVKLGRIDDAKIIFDKAKSNGAKGNGFDRLEEQLRSSRFQNSNAQDTRAKKILETLSNETKKHKNIAIDFKFIFENKSQAIKEIQKGSLIIENKRFILNLEDQKIINNGETQWIYLKEDNEVQIMEHDPDDDLLSPEKIFTIYENNYKQKLIKSEKISNTTTKHYIDLYPKKSEEFIKINLTIIDSKSMRLEKIIMQDKNGGTYTYIIENFDSNTNTEQFNFQVKDYKGIEVIDLR